MFHEDWYSDSQINNLIQLVSSVRSLNGSIIEIGCWEGKSTIAIANKCYPETLICNDTWLGNVEESKVTGQRHITEEIISVRDVYGIFINNMNVNTKGNYKVVKEDCLEWLKTYNKPIKFCHIDASHDYDSVKNTINLLLPNIVKGGILCGDDYQSANILRYELNGGVERAVKESLPQHQNVGNLWYWIK